MMTHQMEQGLIKLSGKANVGGETWNNIKSKFLL